MTIAASNKKILKWGIIFVVLAGLLVLYKLVNPAGQSYFLKCPFLKITGLKCPGCGSQRAVHYLLNADIANALKQNLLLVISIPYIMVGFIFDLIKKPNERVLKWRKRLFGTKAIAVILLLIFSFWIIRNIGCVHWIC